MIGNYLIHGGKISQCLFCRRSVGVSIAYAERGNRSQTKVGDEVGDVGKKVGYSLTTMIANFS